MLTEFVPVFFLSILGVTAGYNPGSGPNPARIRLVLRRPYAYLENRVRQMFEGRADVEVIVDRRRGERRRGDRPVPEERRRAGRRKSREEILEMVIEGDPLTLLGPQG